MQLVSQSGMPLALPTAQEEREKWAETQEVQSGPINPCNKIAGEGLLPGGHVAEKGLLPGVHEVAEEAKDTEMQEGETSNSSAIVASVKIRARKAPAWMKDFVPK